MSFYICTEETENFFFFFFIPMLQEQLTAPPTPLQIPWGRQLHSVSHMKRETTEAETCREFDIANAEHVVHAGQEQHSEAQSW